MGPFPEINRPRRQQHAHAGGNGDHAPPADARTARSTDVSKALSMPGRTRTTAPATSTSIAGPRTISGAGAGAAGDTAGSAKIGTKSGTGRLATVPPTGSASKPAHAARRHPNTCCELRCHCRATSDTTAPGAIASATICALFSADRRRRRPGPVQHLNPAVLRLQVILAVKHSVSSKLPASSKPTTLNPQPGTMAAEHRLRSSPPKSPRAPLHTDEYSIYARLPAWGYGHKTVCHGRGEYARDEDGDGFCEVHVNTIEGSFIAAALVAVPATRHLTRQAAGLSRLFPVRAQRASTWQSLARCPRHRARQITQANTPEPNKSL